MGSWVNGIATWLMGWPVGNVVTNQVNGWPVGLGHLD